MSIGDFIAVISLIITVFSAGVAVGMFREKMEMTALTGNDAVI